MQALQCLGAFASFVVLTCGAVFLTMVTQTYTGEEDRETQFLAAILVACGFLLVIRDWATLGPTVALQSGAVAAASSWFLLVPIGEVLLAVTSAYHQAGYIALGLGAAFIMNELLGRGGWVLGIALAGAIDYMLHAVHPIWAERTGIAFAFFGLYWTIRQFLTLRRPDQWPHVEMASADEHADIGEHFYRACAKWQHMYGFGLQMKALYRVVYGRYQPPQVRRSRSRTLMHLYHGTTWDAGKGIVCDGFRLPSHPGMFGKGIYFADCPLKSWGYTQSLWDPFSCCGRGGIILQCHVELGEHRQERDAAPSLTGYNREGWWAWLTGQHGAYDSVVGLEKGRGGALRLPEYIVYDPSQAVVEYVLEVVAGPPGPPPGYG